MGGHYRVGILIPEWEWGEELRQELGLGQNRDGDSSSTLQWVPSFGHQLPLPSAHCANKPFPKILFSSLIFNQTIKHLNNLVHIQSTPQQHNTAAQEPAQPFPPSQSHHSLIILTAQQHLGFTIFFLLFWKNWKIPSLSQNSSRHSAHSNSFTSGLSPAQMVEGQALTAGLAAQQQGCHYF